MKTHPRSRAGTTFVVIVVFALLASVFVLSYLKLSTEDMRMVKRTVDYQQARTLAEAGLDYGTAKLMHHLNGYRFTMTDATLQNQFNNQLQPPNILPGINPYVFETLSGQSTIKLDVTQPITYGIIPGGTFFGYYGKYQQYEVKAGVRNPETGTAVAIRKLVQISSAHLVSFGLFFEKDLELIPADSMDFNGGIHSNADLYLGGPLVLRDRVTAFQNIFHKSKFNGQLVGNAGIYNNAGTLVRMVNSGVTRDSNHPDWVDLAVQLWDGRVRSAVHGVGYVKPLIASFDNPRDVIQPMLPTTDPNYLEDRENDKFAKKAGLRITASPTAATTFIDFYGDNVNRNNTFRQATVQQSNGLDVRDSRGQYTLSTAGSHGAPTVIYDPRERKQVTVLDLYVGNIISDFGELFSGNKYTISEGRGLIYATFTNRDPTKSYAIRLRNGRSINATAGISIASDLPIYVDGDYNTVSPKVALAAGDSVTFLSNAWQDSRGAGPKSDRIASSTIYNLVVLGGGLETIPHQVDNNGLDSVLRVAESWNGTQFTFSGSVVSMWYSQHFTATLNTAYYDLPRMNLTYDTQYLSMSPPGIPHGFVYDELEWDEIPFSSL